MTQLSVEPVAGEGEEHIKSDQMGNGRITEPTIEPDPGMLSRKKSGPCKERKQLLYWKGLFFLDPKFFRRQ